MNNIKQIREQFDLITEKEEKEDRKLSALVRAGLYDAKKLPALKRAMEKPADKMTAQEKRMMINLLDSLMAEVLSDKQVYRKIKQDVMKEAKSWETKDYLSKNDPRFGRGFPDQKDMPSVLLLKRKGIRVFPDGQKIGLYYAQAIDRYVSIPFQDINVGSHSVNEEIQLNELGLRDMVGGIADFLSGGDNEESKKKEPKYLKPGEAGKAKLGVGGPKEKERDDDRPDATRSRMTSLNRDFMNAQAKSARNVRESFMDKLEVLREEEWEPKKTSIGDLAFKKLRQAKSNQKQWKAGSEAAKKSEFKVTKRDRLPTEKIKDKLVDLYGGTKDAVDRVDRITKTVSGASMGASDIAGSSLDTGAYLKKGEYKNAAKEFGSGVAAPLAVGAFAGKVISKVAKNIKVTNKADDFDVIKPGSDVEMPKMKDVTPSKSTPEAPKNTTEVPKPKQTAGERKAKYSMDLEIQRETNRRASEAMRKASEFRAKNPKSKDTTAAAPKFDNIEKSAGARTKTKDDFVVPKVATDKGKLTPVKNASAADRNAGARVAVKDKSESDFKLAEPATSKGELVTVKPTPKVSSAAPKGTTSGKSTLSYGKWPVPEPKVKQSSSTSTSTEVDPATQVKQQSQNKPQTQTQAKPKKTEPDEPTSTKTKEKGPRGPGLAALLPGLALGAVKGKPLTPGPAKLSLNISGPKREGDPSAIASRTSSLERDMLKAQSKLRESVDLDGNLFELNSKAAKKVTALYESLNTKNKKKMVEAMNESAESLEKVISFAVRQ